MSAPPAGPDFAARAAEALADPFLGRAVRHTVERLSAGKARSTAALGDDWEVLRERGRRVRSHVIEHLDYYLMRFADNVEAQGHHVHFAADAAEATRVVLQIAAEKRARLVAKSKSMLSEEIHLNQALEGQGVECLETDLGEWIIQLAHETPSHLIIPAIHKNRAQIRALFEREGGEPLTPETRVLADYARRRLRARFLEADVGMTGCNFAVAETGSVVLFTNEGNGRMVTTLPNTHVVIMGMERIVPSLEDVALFANLLPRSATGQKLTTYVNVVNGARREGELDGARELHVVIVDNGRSRRLGDPDFQEILNCIRCGACLNVCPVYRQVGGHAYASVYSGPIGAVLTPLLYEDDARARELSQASSLCGACFEACPVKIPLHDMLVRLRRKDAERRPPGLEALAFRAYAAVTRAPWLYRVLARVGRWLAARLGERAARLPLLSAWTRHRSLPVISGPSFRAQLRASKKP